jgi:curli production assembly/transport component CsgG
MANQSSYLITAIIVSSLLSGCGVSTPLKVREAAFSTPNTPNGALLEKLPKPSGKIAVSVYSFNDQTGQKKNPVSGSLSNSSAVTQAGTAILMQALQNSNWFTVLERQGLNNLMKERNIIRLAKKGTKVSPLRSADLLLEGGITGYASNIKTGGSGIEYFGGSISDQYREDFVTVHLRAVEIATGKVVLSVSSSRKVFSKEIRAGLFRYVKFKRLLGIELGTSTNEPGHMAVTDAIEKATHDLIIEGVLKGAWKFKKPSDINSAIVQTYIKDKKG